MHALPYTPPFDWGMQLSWLQTRAIEGVERIDAGSYARGSVVVRNDEAGGVLLVKGSRRDGARARALFDVDADPRAIATVLGRDRLLAPLLQKRPGIRVPGAWDAFELAVRAIVGQQVSVAGARTILGRIAAAHGLTPDVLAEVTVGGMPQRRAETIRTLARAVVLNPMMLERGRSLEESIQALCALPGIGPWTAHYIAMRALREPDAFPAGDLILRRKAGNITERELLQRAERWRPFRAYAAMLLWTSA